MDSQAEEFRILLKYETFFDWAFYRYNEKSLQIVIYSFEFEKVSSTSIKQILLTGELTYLLQ